MKESLDVRDSDQIDSTLGLCGAYVGAPSHPHVSIGVTDRVRSPSTCSLAG